MAKAIIVVDGEKLLDADLTEWRQKPPEQFAELIRCDPQRRPWMKAILVALSDALLTDTAISIEATTTVNGWRMGVDYR